MTTQADSQCPCVNVALVQPSAVTGKSGGGV